MPYPNRIQAVLLLDGQGHDCEAIMRDFTRIEGMRSNAEFQLSQHDPGRSYRLEATAEGMTVTIAYSAQAYDIRLLEVPLASAYTAIVTPDIRSRVARAYSHILLEVSHGESARGEPHLGTAALPDAIGQGMSGATQSAFERRLAVLRLLTQIAIDQAMPLAVHWTQSGILLAGELFEHIAEETRLPGPLHIHPQLYGPAQNPGEPALRGIRTFGARHWMGREIIVKPHFLPWAVNFEAMLAFLRIANQPGGFVIPDGDTFGPEDGSFSYRVLHHDVGADIGYAGPELADVPLYELVPLKHLAHGLIAPDHVPDAAAFDDRALAQGFLPQDAAASAALASAWAERRRVAERAAGRLTVEEMEAPAAAAPIPVVAAPARGPRAAAAPFASSGARVRGFGRKGL